MKNFCVALVAVTLCGSMAMADDTHTAVHTGTIFSMPDGFAGDLFAVTCFGLLAIGLVVFGVWVFDKVTPGNFLAQIAQGNLAAAITIAAIILGLCYAMGTIAHAIIGQ